MMKRGNCLFVVAAAVLCGAGAAQTYVPPPPPLTVDPCRATANPLLPKDPTAKAPPPCAQQPAPKPATGAASTTPTTADQFPFPGESAPAAKSSTAEQFPYPGETGKSPDAVPEGDTPRYVPDGTAPGAPAAPPDSSSSSSSSSSGGSGDPPSPSPDAASSDDEGSHRSHGRRALPKVSAVSPDERVTTDLDVAKFYSDRGNFEGAYLRAKDATRTMPEDPESHFVLAQAAERLQRKEEAASEYALYLKLDPAGSKTAAAQHALSQLR